MHPIDAVGVVSNDLNLLSTLEDLKFSVNSVSLLGLPAYQAKQAHIQLDISCK